MDPLQLLALGLGAAWASGINLYATVLVLGALNLFGVVDLPAGLEPVSNPIVLAVAGLLFFIEFVADKIPGFDSLWDALHTFIRIPAGALIAAGAADGFGGAFLGEDMAFIAALAAGGAVATGSHLSKATSRAMINTSPEPVTNWIASLVEDVAAIGVVLLAVFNPAVIIGFVAVFVLLALWLLPKLWRALRRLLARLGLVSPPPDEHGGGIRFGRDFAPDAAASDARSPDSKGRDSSDASFSEGPGALEDKR